MTKKTKKIIITVVSILLALAFLVPVPLKAKEGGSVYYFGGIVSPFTYANFDFSTYLVIDYHRLNDNPDNPYIEGIGVEIFGITVYENVEEE
jgi:hypothetical protein